MNLTSKKTIEAILTQYGSTPQKRLGQNFLVSPHIVNKVIETSFLSPEDTILEVGPGIGTLTVAMAPYVKKIIAIEKDPRLIPILQETTKNTSSVEIVHGDIRDFFKPGRARKTILPSLPSSYKVVSNLPFYLTNFFLRSILEYPHPPSRITIIIQKEVAERIVAKPPHMNILAVSTQFYADPHIYVFAPRNAFWPQPEVEAAVLSLTPRNLSKTEKEFRDLFFIIVKAGFSHPRKYLIRNLEKGASKKRESLENAFSVLGLNPRIRAQELSLEEWKKLCTRIRKV